MLHKKIAELEFVDIHRSQSIRRAHSESACDGRGSLMDVGGDMSLGGEGAVMARRDGVLWWLQSPLLPPIGAASVLSGSDVKHDS